MPFEMKLPSLAVVAFFGACTGSAIAADATSPIDYTQRNEPYAPKSAIETEKQKPATNAVVQEKRVEKSLVEKKASPLGDRHAAIEMKETREKSVREKDTRRPEVVEQPTSRFNHRVAPMSTAGDTTKPPTVSKYQDSLAAASASNMARFPAMDGATSAKINRFVFRKNPADPAAVTNGAPVVPAAGGSALLPK
jgi:hypothetical protein